MPSSGDRRNGSAVVAGVVVGKALRRALLDGLKPIAAQKDPDTPKTRAYRVVLEPGLRRARLGWAERKSGKLA